MDEDINRDLNTFQNRPIKKHLITILGVIIVALSFFVGFYFKNPYPCSISCCGCESIIKMLADTWSDYFMSFGVLFGIGLIVFDFGGFYER